MAQTDHGESDEISAEKVCVFTFEPYKKSLEFINPGESSLTSKAMFVNLRIEQSFATAFVSLAIALIFVNVGNNAMIEAGFAGILGVKSLVCVEESTLDAEP